VYVGACRIQGLSKFLWVASVMIWNVLEFQEVTTDFFIYLNEPAAQAACCPTSPTPFTPTTLIKSVFDFLYAPREKSFGILLFTL